MFFHLRPETKQAIVQNLGQFEREESITLLESILYQQKELYFVRACSSNGTRKE